MGVVSQESILFNDTIYNNILIGNPKPTKEEVLKASRIQCGRVYLRKRKWL